jgi:cell division protease FtsH
MPIRSLLIWGVVALVLVVLFTVMQGPSANRNAEELSYSQLLNKVEAGDIRQYVIRHLSAERHDGAGC